MKKRIISLMLVFAMVITLLPTSVLATDVSAEPEVPEIAVTFMVDGVVYQTQSPEGTPSKVVKPAIDPTKAGYTFLGWYDGNTEFDFDTEITEKKTLTARFTPVATSYTVTFKPANGNADSTVTVLANGTVSEPANPSRTGYTFLGWYEGSTKFVFSTPITKNTVLTALWSSNSTTVNISSVNVYYNRVTGLVSPANATVRLYKGSTLIGSDTTTSTGSFEIANTFGYSSGRYYDGRYYDGYYDGYYYDGYYYGLNPRDYSTFSSFETAMRARYTGLTTAQIRDIYNNYSDYYYYNRYYDGRYYDDYYRYYDDLSDYYLIAEKDGVTSSRYYLTSGNVRDYNDWYRDGRYYYPTRPSTPDYYYDSTFTILEANTGYSTVRGTGAIPYGYVVVRDSNNVQLGRTDVGSDGRFVITTNRTLRSGEVLRATSSHSNYNDKVTSFVVSGAVPYAPKDFNYKNQFTIGAKAYIQTVNGTSTTKYMDTVPYITNGRTMLPIKFVAESLGYTVTFDEVTRNAVFMSGTNSVVINLNSRDFYVNGVKHTLSVDPITVDGRIMLPVSEIGRALGLTHGNIGEGKNIEWDGRNQVVVIQTNR